MPPYNDPWLAPAETRTCARCGHVLVGEDECGPYYQVLVTTALPDDLLMPGWPATITFADRVHECEGQPHVMPGQEPAA